MYKTATADLNLDTLARHGGLVVQKPIYQAAWLEAMCPRCVATIRIITGIPYGEPPKFCAAYLRAGTGSSELITSDHSIRIPIHRQSRSLSSTGVDSKWNLYRSHPDTGHIFDGTPVPGFEKAIEVCEALHHNVRNFTLIGWDLILNREGEVELMEWNTGQPDIKFAEALQGPCFGGLDLERFAG